jgi:hypothetical protein
MAGHKIVVHFADGRVLKGTTANFTDTAPNFLLAPHGGAGAQPAVVEMSLLKAMFFVRDFFGNPDHKDSKSFQSGQPYAGRRIEVTFRDGEILVGSAPTYSPDMQGFFVFPADPRSNTLKVFALTRAIKSVRWL